MVFVLLLSLSNIVHTTFVTTNISATMNTLIFKTSFLSKSKKDPYIHFFEGTTMETKLHSFFVQSLSPQPMSIFYLLNDLVLF